MFVAFTITITITNTSYLLVAFTITITNTSYLLVAFTITITITNTSYLMRSPPRARIMA